MKKSAFIVILSFSVLFLFGCATAQTTVAVDDDIDLPQRILLIAQSGTQKSLFQTVIDLDSNELVLLEYFGDRLSRVYRTGVQTFPEYYSSIMTSDAPFEEDDDTSSTSTNTDGSPNNDGNPTTSF
jgi:hypothetical protein